MATSNTTGQATSDSRDQQRAHLALDNIRKLWDASTAPPRLTLAATRTPPQSRPPAPQAVVRADVVNVLAYWTRQLATAYPDTLTTPTIGPDGELAEVARYIDLGHPYSTARYLADHLDRIREWGYLGRFLDEVLDLERRLTALLTHPGQDRPLIGPCHLTVDGQTPTRANEHVPRCPGEVRAVPLRNVEDGTVTYQEARCTRCKSVAVIEWWRRQWGASDGLVTGAELARILTRRGIAKVKPGTIRVWTHRGVIHPSGTTEAGERLYDVAAVVMGLNARERNRVAATVTGRGTSTPKQQARA